MMEEEKVIPCPRMDGDVFLLPEMMCNFIKEAIIEHLETRQYENGRVVQWTNSILESVLQSAKTQMDNMTQLDYRLIASCMVLSKTGQRVFRACSGLLNKMTEDRIQDVSAIVRWENDWLFCMVSLYKVD